MTVILTPALALRYLRELSTDLRAAVVLDAGCGLLAGDAAHEAPARELLGVLDELTGEAGDAAGELIVRVHDGGTLRGSALVARGTGGTGGTGGVVGGTGPGAAGGAAGVAAPAFVIAVGPHALLELLRNDLATLLGDLAGDPAQASGDVPVALDQLPTPLPQVTAIDASRRVQAPEAADLAVRTAIFAASGLLAASEPTSAPR